MTMSEMEQPTPDEVLKTLSTWGFNLFDTGDRKKDTLMRMRGWYALSVLSVSHRPFSPDELTKPFKTFLEETITDAETLEIHHQRTQYVGQTWKGEFTSLNAPVIATQGIDAPMKTHRLFVAEIYNDMHRRRMPLRFTEL